MLQYILLLSPHMEITVYSHENIVVEFCSANLRLHCYPESTSLFYVWNHSTGQYIGLQIEKGNYPTNVHPLSWGGKDFFSSITPLHSSTSVRQKWVSAMEVLFSYLFMGFPFNIHAFFWTIWVQRRIAALEASRAKNQVSASMSPADEREGESEGGREQGFMCSLVNESQALKVTGCVYYWSVSRLMGRGEERAQFLSRNQSTHAWEPEEAPSNKLCFTRFVCSHRFRDNPPACWITPLQTRLWLCNKKITSHCSYEMCSLQ